MHHPSRFVQRLTLPLALSAALALSSSGQSTTDGFESEAENEGNWTFSNFLDQPTEFFLLPEGGNPGWRLQEDLCCDFLFSPALRTNGDSAFTGDYRAKQVHRLSVDAKADLLPAGEIRWLPSLYLINHNGTPEDRTDDWGAFVEGPELKILPSYRRVEFEIPFEAQALPSGWQLLPMLPFNFILPPEANWETLITNVDEVSFEFGYVGEIWGHYNVSADNPRVEEGPICSGSFGDGCAGSGGFVPELTFSGCPEAGHVFPLSIRNALGPSSALILFGTERVSSPLGSTCTLNVGSLLPFSLATPTQTGFVPGAGELTLEIQVPAGLTGLTLTMQAFVIDPGAPDLFSATNGIEFVVF